MQNAESMLVLKRLDLVVVHGPVSGAEVHGSVSYLPDSPSRADGLIVNLNIRMQFVIFIKPLRVYGIGKRCTGPCHTDRRETDLSSNKTNCSSAQQANGCYKR